MGTQIELAAADGHKFAAYRAEPKGKPRGALVVVQEIFGVNSHIRGVTDGYAADGYLAIAPAFFDRVQRGVDMGYTPADIEVGRTFIPKMQWDNTLKDLAAAIDNVKSAGRRGVLGYCWGGTVAWVAAARLEGLDCAVAYYGGGIPNMIDEKPKCPVMFHWGETDHAIPLEAARKVAAAHPGAVSYIYQAGHGFNCDQRSSYDAGSAKLARSRSLEFLRQHIG
jgi:carboxymethylenebutenolidase